MPYIKEESRKFLKELEHAIKNNPTQSAGQLNYILTMVAKKYHEHAMNSTIIPPSEYGVINDIIGALEAAKLEFYRRLVSPYEDEKKDENGDVY